MEEWLPVRYWIWKWGRAFYRHLWACLWSCAMLKKMLQPTLVLCFFRPEESLEVRPGTQVVRRFLILSETSISGAFRYLLSGDDACVSRFLRNMLLQVFCTEAGLSTLLPCTSYGGTKIRWKLSSIWSPVQKFACSSSKGTLGKH